MMSLLHFLSLFFLIVESRGMGDFVSKVNCLADNMEVTLRDKIPPPTKGLWKLNVEGYPDCPAAVPENEVAGSHTFSISYKDRLNCGIYPRSIMRPAWVSYADAVLVLHDHNNMTIADSVSCVYSTHFDKSALSFNGDVKSSNLIYGGTVAIEGTDVEGMVRGQDAITMHFLDQFGRELDNSHVKLGEDVILAISVVDRKSVSQVLPQNCYFSSSSVPEEIGGIQTLPFVRKSCFNSANGVVRTMLPKMERSYDGSQFQLKFPAFHFTESGRSLYVHCTMVVCVANQRICQPNPGCFSTDDRRKRDVGTSEVELEEDSDSQQVSFTKFLVIEPERKKEALGWSMPECISPVQVMAMGLVLAIIIILCLSCVTCFCWFRRQRPHNSKRREEEDNFHAIPIVTSF